MGDAADDLRDWEDDAGVFSFEQRIAMVPPHIWIANDGRRYVIAKMEARHVVNTVKMLNRWVKEGRGRNEAAIVGRERWANLLRRYKEAKEETWPMNRR